MIFVFEYVYLNVIDCMITICENLNTEPNLFDEKDYDAELDALIDRMYKAGESESETAPPHDYDDEETLEKMGELADEWDDFGKYDKALAIKNVYWKTRY